MQENKSFRKRLLFQRKTTMLSLKKIWSYSKRLYIEKKIASKFSEEKKVTVAYFILVNHLLSIRTMFSLWIVVVVIIWPEMKVFLSILIIRWIHKLKWEMEPWWIPKANVWSKSKQKRSKESSRSFTSAWLGMKHTMYGSTSRTWILCSFLE